MSTYKSDRPDYRVSRSLLARLQHSAVLTPTIGAGWKSIPGDPVGTDRAIKDALAASQQQWVRRFSRLTSGPRPFPATPSAAASALHCPSGSYVLGPRPKFCGLRPCPFCWMRSMVAKSYGKIHDQLIDHTDGGLRLVDFSYHHSLPCRSSSQLAQIKSQWVAADRRFFQGFGGASAFVSLIVPDALDALGSVRVLLRRLMWVPEGQVVSLKEKLLHIQDRAALSVVWGSTQSADRYTAAFSALKRLTSYPSEWMHDDADRMADLFRWMKAVKYRTIEFSGLFRKEYTHANLGRA